MAGGNVDWRGGGGGGGFPNFNEVERDDFYPDRVSTHILHSAERYQKDWSKMGPKDQTLET